MCAYIYIYIYIYIYVESKPHAFVEKPRRSIRKVIWIQLSATSDPWPSRNAKPSPRPLPGEVPESSPRQVGPSLKGDSPVAPVGHGSWLSGLADG